MPQDKILSGFRLDVYTYVKKHPRETSYEISRALSKEIRFVQSALYSLCNTYNKMEYEDVEQDGRISRKYFI